MRYQRLMCTEWICRWIVWPWIFWPLYTFLLSCQPAACQSDASWKGKFAIEYSWIICRKINHQYYLINIVYAYAKMWLLHYSFILKLRRLLVIRMKNLWQKYSTVFEHIFCARHMAASFCRKMNIFGAFLEWFILTTYYPLQATEILLGIISKR